MRLPTKRRRWFLKVIGSTNERGICITLLNISWIRQEIAVDLQETPCAHVLLIKQYAEDLFADSQ
jgi:hypothetical protein